jgi:hypothetical protein
MILGLLLRDVRRTPWRDVEAIERLVGKGNLSCGVRSNQLALWMIRGASLVNCQACFTGSRLWVEPEYSSPLDLLLTETLSLAQFPELSERLARLPAGIYIKVQGIRGNDAEIAKLMAPLAGKISSFMVFQGPAIGDQTLAALLPAAKEEMMDLRLAGTAVTDAGLANLGSCSKLRCLILRNTQVTDGGLASLAGCKSLWILDLAETQLTDAGLALVANCPELRMLALQKTAVTAAGLAALARCPFLMMLYAANTNATPASLAALQAEFAKRDQRLDLPPDPVFHMPR